MTKQVPNVPVLKRRLLDIIRAMAKQEREVSRCAKYNACDDYPLFSYTEYLKALTKIVREWRE